MDGDLVGMVNMPVCSLARYLICGAALKAGWKTGVERVIRSGDDVSKTIHARAVETVFICGIRA